MSQIVLIVDDEKATRDGLRMALEDTFDCYVAADLKQARQILKSEPVDILLTDLRLGTESGMDLLDEALTMPRPPVSIMMTAYGSVDTAVEAMRRGAWNFVTKPLHLDEVELLLTRAARGRSVESENRRLTTENRELKKKSGKSTSGLERLIGKSPTLNRVIQTIEQVAPTRATVLIEGESGTGKELVAHAIHDLSGRPADKLVIVNCAALSPQILESELFGHEKGAFTGASQRRIGRFEQADGGTLFLDEIGEIDPSIQVKLLRVLSERTIQRVGSNESIPVDVRLVTATNKELRELVAQGKFREDLFFRLHVVTITMPPLRERPEDIVLLANTFLKEFALENGRPIKPLTDPALDSLRGYQWPGNVRELRTAMEHGVVMSNQDEIDLPHLPSFLAAPVRPSRSGPHPGPGIPPGENDLALGGEFNLDALEAHAIHGALRHADGNRTKAAELLGLSRRTLQRKLKHLSSTSDLT
jgi:two-component system response regulator AtoC